MIPEDSLSCPIWENILPPPLPAGSVLTPNDIRLTGVCVSVVVTVCEC